MTTNFSDDVHSLHAFHLKFTINGNHVLRGSVSTVLTATG